VQAGDRMKLAGWKEFCEQCRKHGDAFCQSSVRSNLNRCNARFQLASRFERVCAEGYAEKTMVGYSSGIRLMLAYSAAELLGVAIGGGGINSWKIERPELAVKLRKVLAKSSRQGDDLFTKKLREKLNEFMDGESDDVRIAATALRVMVAHGTFTPTGTDALTKGGSSTINTLADELLNECNIRFSGWFENRQVTLIRESIDHEKSRGNLWKIKKS